MDIKIIIALIGVGGTLFGAVVGTVGSIYSTKETLKMNSNLIIIDIHKRDIEALTELSRNLHTIHPPKDDAFSQQIDIFMQEASAFLAVAYLFPDSLEKDVYSVFGRISKASLRAKFGEHISQKEGQMLIDDAGKIQRKMKQAVAERLREKQAIIQELTH